MKVTIEFKDGHVEVLEDVMPSFSPEEDEFDVIDKNMMSGGDPLTLSLLKKVTWEVE